MAHKIHPNSLANLKNINDQPNAHKGRPPAMAKVIKTIPEDAQKKVYSILWTAISMSSVKEASKYISKEADNLPECGFVLQIALRALQGKDGFKALMDILDRLFGKPKIVAEVEAEGNLSVQGINVVVSNSETEKKLNKILKK